MIRSILLSGVALLALCGTANAQIPVTDIALNSQTIANAVKDAAYWAKQAADMAQQYQQAKATYEALAHITDVQGALSALGGVTQTWMPPGNELPGLLSGTAGLWGAAASFSQANSVDGFMGSLSSGSWQIEELLRRGYSTANFQALAQEATLDAQTHITALADLEARLGACQDVTCNTAISGEIALYQQNLDGHRAQIESLNLAQASQTKVDEIRQEQQRLKVIQDAYDATRGAGPLQ